MTGPSSSQLARAMRASRILAMLFLLLSTSKIIVIAQEVTLNDITGTTEQIASTGVDSLEGARELLAMLEPLRRNLQAQAADSPHPFGILGDALMRAAPARGLPGLPTIPGLTDLQNLFTMPADILSPAGARGFLQTLPSPVQVYDFLSDPIAVLAPGPLPPDAEALFRSGTVVIGPGGVRLSRSQALGIIAAVFGVVSNVLNIISFSLGVASSSLGVLTTGIATVTGPAAWFLTVAAAEQALSSGFQAQRDELYNEWKTALLNCADALQGLNNGTISINLGATRNRLQQAAQMLSAINFPTASA